MGLMSGSIPMMAIQLDALRVGDQLLLNFTPILDLTELRGDDTDDDGGGGQADRAYWEKKVGAGLMSLSDEILGMINGSATTPQEFNYLRGYIGLQSNGVVKNFIHLSPKRTKKFVHVVFRNSNAAAWKDRFEEVGVPVSSKRAKRFRITVTNEKFAENKELIGEAIAESVKEFEQ